MCGVQAQRDAAHARIGRGGLGRVGGGRLGGGRVGGAGVAVIGVQGTGVGDGHQRHVRRLGQYARGGHPVADELHARSRRLGEHRPHPFAERAQRKFFGHGLVGVPVGRAQAAQRQQRLVVCWAQRSAGGLEVFPVDAGFDPAPRRALHQRAHPNVGDRGGDSGTEPARPGLGPREPQRGRHPLDGGLPGLTRRRHHRGEHLLPYRWSGARRRGTPPTAGRWLLTVGRSAGWRLTLDPARAGCHGQVGQLDTDRPRFASRDDRGDGVFAVGANRAGAVAVQPGQQRHPWLADHLVADMHLVRLTSSALDQGAEKAGAVAPQLGDVADLGVGTGATAEPVTKARVGPVLEPARGSGRVGVESARSHAATLTVITDKVAGAPPGSASAARSPRSRGDRLVRTPQSRALPRRGRVSNSARPCLRPAEIRSAPVRR